jgi:Flp pilus assembly protein TadG
MGNTMTINEPWKGRRFARDDEGVTTLEITIVFPVFFAALMLVFQAAMYHFAAQVALAAAQTGARVTAVELNQTTITREKAISDGQTAAIEYLQSVEGGRVQHVDAKLAAADSGQIQFVVTGDMIPLPFIPPLALPISRNAIANPEIFTHG